MMTTTMLGKTLLLISALLILEPPINCLDFEESYIVDDGLLTMSVSHAKTNLLPGGLKLRKIVGKKEIESLLVPTTQTMLFALKDEIDNCNKLPPFLRQHKRKLDCRKNNGEEYLKRTTVMLDYEHFIHTRNIQADLGTKIDLYPIDFEESRRSFDSVLAGAGVSLDGATLGLYSRPFGFYFKLILTLGDKINVRCAGKLIGGVNATEDFNKNDPMDLFELHWLKQGFEHGIVLNFPEFECAYSDQHQVLSLKNNFLFIQQQRFPYLVLRHSSATSPLNQIWEMSASINQTTHHQPPFTPNTPYNTTLNVLSKSIWPMLNFNIVQQTSNHNSTQGVESFFFVSPQSELMLAMNSFWNDAILTRIFSLSTSMSSNPLERVVEPVLDFKYVNDTDDDHVQLVMRVKKDYISWIKSEFSNEEVAEERDEL